MDVLIEVRYDRITMGHRFIGVGPGFHDCGTRKLKIWHLEQYEVFEVARDNFFKWFAGRPHKFKFYYRVEMRDYRAVGWDATLGGGGIVRGRGDDG